MAIIYSIGCSLYLRDKTLIVAINDREHTDLDCRIFDPCDLKLIYETLDANQKNQCENHQIIQKAGDTTTTYTLLLETIITDKIVEAESHTLLAEMKILVETYYERKRHENVFKKSFTISSELSDVFCFENSRFYDSVWLTSSLDSKQQALSYGVGFSFCRFDHTINFDYGSLAHMGGGRSFSFSRCIFSCGFFVSGEFPKNTSFDKVSFEKEAIFWNTTFQNIRFSGCRFSNNVEFLESSFLERALFENVLFEKM